MEREITGNVSELVFKNFLFKTSGTITSLWVTLTPESAILTPRTIMQLYDTLEVVIDHAKSCWYDDFEQAS